MKYTPPVCRTIGSAARLLSEELYTKPTHFILELVQNADDCLYEEGMKPELQFDLFEDALLLSSNEVGFDEANVRAICNLGGSTKVGTATHATGRFTGEKGEGPLCRSSSCYSCSRNIRMALLMPPWHQACIFSECDMWHV